MFVQLMSMILMRKDSMNPNLEQNESTGWMVKLVEYPRKEIPGEI